MVAAILCAGVPSVACAQSGDPAIDALVAREAGAAPPSAPPAETRVVGLRLYPGAGEVATLTLENPQLRERVTALQARLGSRAVITRLEAGIFRLPGAVPEERVLAFYRRELGEELTRRRGEEADGATKTGAAPPPEGAHVSRLPGGRGFLSISVDPDPLQPRDTRVVVVRVEGSPEVQGMLKQLMQIVSAVHLASTAAPAGRLDLAAPALAAPAGAAPGVPLLPVFPNSQPQVATRLNAAQVQALARSLAGSSYSPAVRQGIADLLRQARAVTLNVYRVPRPVPGASVVEFYRGVMATYGATELVRDTSDPNRPLLVYALPANAGVIMIRAYPERAPLTPFTLAPLSSPISTGISVLRIDGATLKLPGAANP